MITLGDIGWSIDVADNGQQAVDLVAGNEYQLILMDMHMPVMDGIEATRKIRQLPHGQRCPIVAMTANAFSEDRERCLGVGMNGFVTKPVSPAVLYETILGCLSPASGEGSRHGDLDGGEKKTAEKKHKVLEMPE